MSFNWGDRLMYGLCDCNNFFASCERVFNPSLRCRPVVVLSSNDGCVIARSNEAKALGIKMGQPFFQLRELVEREKVAIFSTNFVLYGDMSRRVMRLLGESVPALEVYSIDEAFMDFSGVALSELSPLGLELARSVKRQTGIPVSIGIAPTKTLAKIASKLCKQYPRLNGCCVMHRKEDIEKVLNTFPIEDVWGVGRRYSKMLQSFGIATAYQFTLSPPEWVRQKMSVVGLRTWKELRGEPCIGFEHTPTDKQSICVSRSFAKEVTLYDQLQVAVANFASTAALKLRKQNSVCGQLSVFIYTNRFRTDLPQAYESRLAKFPVPTASTLELIHHANKLLRELFREGYGYKKAGVMLSDIMPSGGVQTNIFDTVDRTKHSRLMTAVDRINKSEGAGTVVVAAQGFENVQFNREHLSPYYTTNWDDIITVKV